MAQNGYRVANVVASRSLRRAPRYLPVMLLFMTNRCNLRCKMCGVCEHNTASQPKPELSTAEWKAVIDSAKKLGTSLISVSGGEPLLRPDVYEVIRYARDRNIAVHLCSNGVLFDRETAEKLRESRVNTVSISIESPVKEIHELLRGPDSFEPATNAIRMLREFAPEVNVGINYLITTANFRNMSAMIKFAEDLDVNQIKFAPIHTNLLHKRKRIEQYGDLIFKGEDLDVLDDEVHALMKAAERSKIQTASAVFFSGVSRLYREPRRFRCYAGYAVCAINPSGVVTPCCDMEGSLSVKDKPLEEIWRSPEFQQLRSQVTRCSSSCWDTTNAELSLRLRIASLFGEFAQTWRDIEFYYGRKNR